MPEGLKVAREQIGEAGALLRAEGAMAFGEVERALEDVGAQAPRHGGEAVDPEGARALLAVLPPSGVPRASARKIDVCDQRTFSFQP